MRKRKKEVRERADGLCDRRYYNKNTMAISGLDLLEQKLFKFFKDDRYRKDDGKSDDLYTVE